MTRTELLELIKNGESSGVEFKRDTIENRALAKELVAFANVAGGRVLIGVEDDGAVPGKGMLAHNGTEPELIENDEQFVVRLWK